TRTAKNEDKMRINELTIKQLPHPETGQNRYRDDGLPGFGVIVGKRAKTFFVMHGKDRRVQSIGRWPAMSVKEARLEASALISDPPPKKPQISLEEARDTFLDDCRRRLRPSTAERYYYGLKDIDLADTKIADPTTVKCLKAFYNWCIEHELLDRNPFARRKIKFRTRDRLLTDDEIAAIWAVDQRPFSDIAKLLILTGQRRNQIWRFDPAWVHGEELTFPASIMKSARPHTIPVTGFGEYLPALPFSFNSWSKSKRRLDKTCGVADWVLHDLRRYFSSTMARLGVPLHVTEQLIDHRSQVSGVAAIYNRYNFLKEMREALAAYETHIFGLVAEKHTSS
ncbi:MAG: integrase family protein, partial [Pseudomonadota bacterium]